MDRKLGRLTIVRTSLWAPLCLLLACSAAKAQVTCMQNGQMTYCDGQLSQQPQTFNWLPYVQQQPNFAAQAQQARQAALQNQLLQEQIQEERSKQELYAQQAAAPPQQPAAPSPSASPEASLNTVADFVSQPIDKGSAEQHLTVAWNALVAANDALRARNQQPLFCINTIMDAGAPIKIVGDGLSTLTNEQWKTADRILIEGVLLAGLQKDFPCPTDKPQHRDKHRASAHQGSGP
jgi:hypothetical protein